MNSYKNKSLEKDLHIPYRNLLNPKILSDYHYEGFQGDSEFIDSNGELQFGSWTFVIVFDAWLSNHNYPTLDSTISETELIESDSVYVELLNDDGNCVGVEFKYYKGGESDDR